MTDLKGKCGVALAGLFIGGGLLGSGYFAAEAFKDIKLANQMLTVKGFSHKDVVSDYAKWHGSFTEAAQSKQEVYNKLLLTKEKVSAYLISQGLKS